MAEGFPDSADSVVVMLDGEHTYKQFADQDIDIYWGAYVGTPDEILVSGKLKDVADEIERIRTDARRANGWIMDSYLMRRATGVNRSAAFEVKGWCPGALRPMQSGDGLIVRVRPRSGDACAGRIDRSRRRGSAFRQRPHRPDAAGQPANSRCQRSNFAATARRDRPTGAARRHPDGEAVRNVMISPLAGIDPAEVLDVEKHRSRACANAGIRTLSLGVAVQVRFHRRWWRCSDACGAARRRSSCGYCNGPEAAVAIGLDTQDGNGVAGFGLSRYRGVSCDRNRPSLPRCGVERDAATHARPFRRGLASIRSAMASRLDPLRENPRKTDVSLDRRVGLIELGAGRFAVGIAAPFGRVETDQLGKLADEMAAHGGQGDQAVALARALCRGAQPCIGRKRILDAAARDRFDR